MTAAPLCYFSQVQLRKITKRVWKQIYKIKNCYLEQMGKGELLLLVEEYLKLTKITLQRNF